MTSARAAQRVCFFFLLSFLFLSLWLLDLVKLWVFWKEYFNFYVFTHEFQCLPLSSLFLLCHFVATLWGCCTPSTWSHNASLRACRLMCVCVCGWDGDNPSWYNSFVSQRAWMWLCASLCRAKQVESTVCVCADVSHLLCMLGRTDVLLTRVGWWVISFKEQGISAGHHSEDDWAIFSPLMMSDHVDDRGFIQWYKSVSLVNGRCLTKLALTSAK